MHLNDPNEEDGDMTATENAGGRVDFTIGEPTRYLDLSGAVSPDIYLVQQARSDRKGLVTLKQENGNRIVNVHHRRLLPVALNDEAVVIESQDRHYALCPRDNYPVPVESIHQSMTCPQCSQTFNLHWIGVKPMTDTTKAEKPATATIVKTPKTEKANKPAPKEPKPPKTAKEPIVVDLTALAALKDCELWTKKNVKFDHHAIDVQAHMLLFVGDNPRKLSFNTYNGTLGKKATAALPIDQFVAGETSTKTPWYAIQDLEKARKQLAANLYEQHK